MTGDAPCAICAMVGAEPAGGWAYEDESWVAGTLSGLDVPGWIVLALRRHAVESAPLDEREAMRLGLAIRRLSAAVESVTNAERVYLQTYGEVERHWHLLISARGPAVPEAHRHAAWFAHRHEYLDAPAAERVIRDVRSLVMVEPTVRAPAVS
jgi:diadenosine tetraphosphate (Ap4A) HIT family hydrolase